MIDSGEVLRQKFSLGVPPPLLLVVLLWHSDRLSAYLLTHGFHFCFREALCYARQLLLQLRHLVQRGLPRLRLLHQPGHVKLVVHIRGDLEENKTAY